MGKTVVLDGPTAAWAKERFRTYYGAAVLEPPKGLARREFAWFPFGAETVMRRHQALPTAERFKAFVRSEVPRHLYYSTAYFEAPDAPTMAQKEWLGADVIFDLDADQLRGSAGKTFSGQLELAKERVRDLFDDFLQRDFGLDQSQLLLVFSGGRGYHIHVRDDAYARLGATERREIVDYVLGAGVDVNKAIELRRAKAEGGSLELAPDAAEENGRRGRRRETKQFPYLVSEDNPGWAGRLSREYRGNLRRWMALGREDTERELRAWDIPPRLAKSLSVELIDEGKAASIFETGALDTFRREGLEYMLKGVLERSKIEVQGETDAPVTTDLHRLIRLPGSLHGGTGFRVTPMPRERLDRFDPFRDALPFVGPGSTEVELVAEVDHPFEAPVVGRSGERRRLPDAQALFLVLRGEATLPPGPGP